MSFILGYKLSGNKKSLLRFENGIGKVHIMLPVNNGSMSIVGVKIQKNEKK